MSNLEVRIVNLEALYVAYASGFSESPEADAWEMLLSWAKSKGLLDNGQSHRFFGHNNPNPSPGSPNYGYDQWMTVAPSIKSEGKIKTKSFAGGLYAVTRCKGIDNISKTWKKLVAWHEDSPYKTAHHQWLEECVSPPDSPFDKIVMDLYLPIAK